MPSRVLQYHCGVGDESCLIETIRPEPKSEKESYGSWFTGATTACCHLDPSYSTGPRMVYPERTHVRPEQGGRPSSVSGRALTSTEDTESRVMKKSIEVLARIVGGSHGTSDLEIIALS